MSTSFVNLTDEMEKRLLNKIRLGNPYGEIVINEDHKIVMFNRIVCEKLGYHESYLKGLDFNLLLPKYMAGYDGDFQEWHKENLIKWFVKPNAIHLQERRTKNGDLVTFHLLGDNEKLVACRVAIRCVAINNLGDKMYDSKPLLKFGVASIYWIDDFEK